jgi:hypothetical protein
MLLKERILNNLRAAHENGYSFTGWTAQEIAVDMLDYCPDEHLTEANFDEVVSVISELQRAGLVV